MIYSIMYFIAPYVCGLSAGFLIGKMIGSNKKTIVITGRRKRKLNEDYSQLKLFKE